MKWHVYELPPVDFGWHLMKTVANTAADLAAMEAAAKAEHGEGVGFEDVDSGSFLSSWQSAKHAALEKGWEGDFRHPPVVFWLPYGDGFTQGFAFKQDNNGTSFVVSPVPLFWLEKA